MSKPRTAEQKLKDTDKRLQKKFGITLDQRNKMVTEQEGRCKICGGPLDAYGPPNIDHYHFFVKEFRETQPAMIFMKLSWYAQAYDELGRVICVKRAKTKAQARADVKIAMMPWSIRGLLCFKCNRGLGAIEKFFGPPATLITSYLYVNTCSID